MMGLIKRMFGKSELREGYRDDAIRWESSRNGDKRASGIAARANRREVMKDIVKSYLNKLPVEVELRLLREYWQALGTRDANEPMIVNELRKAGYEVEYNAPSLPDLLAISLSRAFYVEVKFEPSRLSKKQREIFKTLDLSVYLACTLDDVRKIVNDEAEDLILV